MYGLLIKFASSYQLITLFPYGPYFAVIWKNIKSLIGKASYLYQIYTTEFTALNNEEIFFATGDQPSAIATIRISKKVYAMLYNRVNDAFADAVVGQLLS